MDNFVFLIDCKCKRFFIFYYYYFFNYGRTLKRTTYVDFKSTKPWSPPIGSFLTPATFFINCCHFLSESPEGLQKFHLTESEKQHRCRQTEEGVGAEGTRRLQICKPLLWTRFSFFPTRPLRTNKRLVDTEESSERATAEGENTVWHEAKCLGLVILSDFLFFMEKRRRDKTNGMSQKCQEAIKTKRPQPQTELSTATANSVCLSVSSHGRVAALSDRKQPLKPVTSRGVGSLRFGWGKGGKCSRGCWFYSLGN